MTVFRWSFFLRLRFGLLLAALVLAVLAWLVSLIPLWLVASTAINALFTVRHPLLALRLGGAAPETAWGEHGAREMHEHLSAFCVAALLPLLLWVAPERALVSVALSGALVAGGMARSARRAGDNAPPPAEARGSRLRGPPQVAVWQLRQWWDQLPAPAVHNTADDE